MATRMVLKLKAPKRATMTLKTTVRKQKVPYSPSFSRDLNFAKIFSAHFANL